MLDRIPSKECINHIPGKRISPYWVDYEIGIEHDLDWLEVRGWANVWVCPNCGGYIIEIDYRQAYAPHDPSIM